MAIVERRDRKWWIGCIVLSFFIFHLSPLFAAETTLVGEIYDAKTGVPIANVNLSLVGTTIGTTTNAEGIFLLRADINRRTTLAVSAIGYKTQRIKVEPGISAGIDIALEEKTTQLEDVFILPGANPALPLMARARSLRKQNAVAYEVAQTDQVTDVYVSDIQARHLKRRLWQQLSEGFIQTEDSTYLLPLYHSEMSNGEKHTQALILSEADYQAQLAYLDNTPDFYRNTIAFYGANFLSPLAAEGNAYYRYYLADSILTEDGRKAYIVDFRTKNPFYPTFNGTMTLDSLSCALLAIDATVSPQVNINYLRGLTFRQTFQPSTAQYQLSTAEADLLLDYAVRIDTSRTLPTIYIRHRASTAAASEQQHLTTAHDSIQDMQTVADMPLIRVADFFAKTILTGYIPAGKWLEVGNINQLFRVTPTEGVRLGIGLRTSEQLMKNVCIDAYAGYGFRDQAFKGGVGLHLNLPTPHRHQLHLTFSDDYRWLDRLGLSDSYLENASLFRQRDFTTALTQAFVPASKVSYNSQIRVREFRLSSSNEWTDYLEQDIYGSVARVSQGRKWFDYSWQDDFLMTSVGTLLRLSFDERKVDLFFRRIHVYGRLPILYLGLETGTIRTSDLSTYRLYGRLQLLVRQEVPLGMMGRLDYLFEAGLVLGRVPYPMLETFSANQSVAYALDRFSLMHNLQYGADRYMLLHLKWNGRGCLFNLIPGVRYLRLRELATFKIAWGGLSEKNRPEQSDLYQSLTVPYVEIGVGIGNILRICDIHSVWRLTHRNEPASPNWAIRFSLQLDN